MTVPQRSQDTDKWKRCQAHLHLHNMTDICFLHKVLEAQASEKYQLGNAQNFILLVNAKI